MSHESTYRLSVLDYYLDWVTVPLSVLISVGWLIFQGFNPVLFASAVAVGGVSWSLVEYLVHRFVLHGANRFARQHGTHHANPAEYIGVSPKTTILLFAAAGLLTPYLLGPSIGVGFFVGFILWYLAYIVLHDRFHHGTPEGSMYSHHDYHHRLSRFNYGVSTRLWDDVFGTKAL